MATGEVPTDNSDAPTELYELDGLLLSGLDAAVRSVRVVKGEIQTPRTYEEKRRIQDMISRAEALAVHDYGVVEPYYRD